MSFQETTTYLGRFRTFLELTSIRHLFHTKRTIQRCQKQLETADPKNAEAASEDAACSAIVAACVHPNTKEIIPVYGRMASFVPVNIPVCAGMLLAPPTLPNLIGWQWINQTYNAVFNYCNSAKAKPATTATDSGRGGGGTGLASFLGDYGDIAKGYTGSVIVSVGLAVGLTQWLKIARVTPSVRRALQMVVPYTATASAGMANVILMRSSEFKTGLPVHTAEGAYVGHSKIAARKAVLETAVSRAVLSIPILLLPPPCIALALRWRVLAQSKVLKMMTELGFLVGAIAIGLPSAIALYPQRSTLPVQALEPFLQTAVHGEPCVYFNKGV